MVPCPGEHKKVTDQVVINLTGEYMDYDLSSQTNIANGPALGGPHQ